MCTYGMLWSHWWGRGSLVGGVAHWWGHGSHSLQGSKTVKLLVQLKLNERVRNNFDQCEVHMPFFHRWVPSARGA